MVRETTVNDIINIKGFILPEIEKEITATGGSSAHDELINYCKESDVTYTLLADKIPVCVFGVMNIDGKGLVWFFTSTEVYKYPIAFYKACRNFLKEILKNYSKLFGQVSQDFKKSINFFKRLGFTIAKEIQCKNELGYELELGGK